MVRYSVYKLTAGELTGSGPRSASKPDSIFVAYSFATKDSHAIRIKFEQRLRRTVSLRNLRISDGHVPVGTSWATEIRQRLTDARLVVADLTLLSPEVLFECGFAWGLGRPILPITRVSPTDAQLPRWLTDLQVGDLSSEKGWGHLIDSVGAHLQEPKSRRNSRRLPPSIPGLIVVLPTPPITDAIVGHVNQVAARYGMRKPEICEGSVEALAATEPNIVNNVARASLLVAGLNQSPSDSFVHFAAGVIVAHPKAGASRRLLDRRVLLVVPSAKQLSELTADSARRVEPTVRTVTQTDVSAELTRYGTAYQRWDRSQGEDA